MLYADYPKGSAYGGDDERAHQRIMPMTFHLPERARRRNPIHLMARKTAAA